MHLTIRGSERVKECIFMAAFSQNKIRRVVSDMEHKSWKRKNNTGVPAEVIHHPGAGVEVPLLHFPLLEKTGIVKEGFTTRLGGVSEGIFSTMNLSFTRGDEEEAVRENYRRLASALDVDYDKFVFTDQTHTTNVRKVTAEDAGNGLTREREFHDTDGLITDVPGLVLSTFYADCVPLYFVDPVHCAIGLSHSGWRGTVNRMGKATIEAMRREYGSRPEELRCAIGPSICQDCYEVSGDVAVEFERLIRGLNPWPSAYTHLDNKAFKIWKARVVETDGAYAPGCICKVGKNTMVVQTGEGGLELLEVQLAGKKRMDAGSFLRGYPVAEGSFLQQ